MPAATKEEQIRADTARLHQLGYAQQLFRDMGGFSNFAISFTIISVLTGGLTLYGYGLNHGGPQQMGIGWLLVGVMVLVVAAAMAQLASALPTAGALYYQAAKLGNKHWGWITGWFNLIGQITITTGIVFGNAIYDASAHVTEETVNPARRAPWGIVNSVFWSLIFGYLMLLALTLAIPDLAATAKSGNPVLDIVKTALGSTGGLLLFAGFVIAQAFCGLSSITSNSRMLFAFSRDGALPGSKWLHVVSKKYRTPARAIWVAAIIAFIPALAQFPVPAVYSIVVSISVIGLYVSYVIPVLLALIYPKRWTPGPWNLGRYWPIVGWVAVVWVAFISVVLMLPEYQADYTGDIIGWLTATGTWAGPSVAVV